MLRKSKIVLMDEATSSIDYNTETLINKKVNRKSFKRFNSCDNCT